MTFLIDATVKRDGDSDCDKHDKQTELFVFFKA